MELIVIQNEQRVEVVLFDDEMRIIRPVYGFLQNQKRRGRAFNTIKANGRDMKNYYSFLSEYSYKADEATSDTILDYVDYLRNSNGIPALYKESALKAQSINRMLSTVRSFYKFYEITYGAVNPILVEEVYHGNVHKGMLAHIRNDNRIKSSVFKIKEAKRRIEMV